MKSNPRMKRILLEIVDNQLRDNTPLITRETYERLKTLGYSDKQVKEKIAAVVAEDIYNILKENKPHNVARYEQKLRALE
jgi:Holliday junction resolvasome RuvABC DNA-binding subunit